MTVRSFTIIMVVICLSCTLNDLQLPEWDTTWEIALQGDEVSASEILKDVSFLDDSTNNTTDKNTYFVDISDTSAAQVITSKDMSIKTENHQFSAKLGNFNIDQPEPQVINGSSFAELFGELNPEPGFPFPALSPTIITPVPGQIEFNEFDEMDIESASLSVIFHNNLILEIDRGMTITIKDMEHINDPGEGVIDTIRFSEPVPPNSSLTSDEISLAGKSISNKLQLEYRIPLTGTDSVIILDQNDLDSDFSVEVIMSQLVVSRAIAKIPVQHIIRKDDMTVDTDECSVRLAEIDKGSVNLTVKNGMNIGSDIEIEMPNFVDKTNKPLLKNYFVKAKESKNIKINLAGYTLQNEQQNGSYLENINYNMIATTRESEIHILVNSRDSINVQIQGETLFFKYFEGNINRYKIEFAPVHKEDIKDLKNIEGYFSLPDLAITINVHNEINYDLTINMELTGYHRDPRTLQLTDSASIEMNKVFQRNSLEKNQSFVITNESKPEILDFISIVPNEVTAKCNVQISGEGSMRKGDKVWMDYTINSPLTLKIEQPLIYTAQKQIIGDKEMSNDRRESISKSLTELELKINSDNRLPVDTELMLYVSTDSVNLFSDIIDDSTQKFILSGSFEGGNVDDEGFVETGRKEEQTIALTNSQIAVFENNPLYYGFKVKIPTTDSPVEFSSSNTFYYDPVLKFNVLMNADN